ncbi:MAG: hypothetical protein ACT4O5_08775 [Gammaproteobacteria bacterium]
MSKHTPGPWIASDVGAPGDAEVMVWQYNGRSDYYHNQRSIAECHFNTFSEIRRGEVGCNEVEAQANARLIAAAPDLLEAARDALEELHRVSPSRAAPKLRAAIAKATQS